MNVVKNSGLDWARYVDVHGLGWHYDKTSGHKEDSQDSPLGTQIGTLVVSEEFANEAITMFPDTCSELDEEEFEDFYDNKAHSHEPDEVFDLPVLEGIQAKISLGLPLTIQQQEAIDSNSNTPGIRKNKKRFWKDMKKDTGVKIVKIKK